MNSITRLILRRLASGEASLTWEIVKALKEANADRTSPKNSKPAESKSNNNTDETAPPESGINSRLTFVNPLPGRWIRRTSCATISAVLLTACALCATATPGNFEAANAAFARGNYVEAVNGFESVVAEQGYSSPVLFNLANAQQRGGRLGEAILNYERAALLAPNDPDIVANLNLARQQAGLETKALSPLQNAVRALTLNTWFGVATAALFLIAVALPLKQLRPQVRGGMNFVTVIATFALLVAVGALGLRRSDLHRAVVTTPEAVAGVSPVTMAQPVFKLRAGKAVRVQQTHGDFALIRNHAGHEGWVKLREIEQVVPPSATRLKN